MKNLALYLLSVLLFAGCSTVTTYDSKTDAGPAKPSDYPIYVYTEKVEIPRPSEVIGNMHVGDTPFTMKGGSLNAVLDTLRENARKKGADALKITSIETPGFSSGNFKVDAKFLRFTDSWESVGLSKEQVLAYFKNNEKTLDPIEGIWFENFPVQSRIAIMKNTSKAGRDFIAFIIGTRNPSWRIGDKKMDITRGERSGVYRIDYYLDDYEKKGAVLTLSGTPADKLIVHMPDDAGFIQYTKE